MENVAVQTNFEASKQVVKKPRIEWLDVAKFLGIVLVFVAHGVYLEETNLFRCLYRGVIYSFHMPLFFIVSMMTTSLSDSKQTFIKKTKKRAIHLLIPFVIMWIVYIFIDIFYFKRNLTYNNWWGEHIARLFGFEYDDSLVAGPAWFFMTLFIGQTVFDLLHLLLKRDSYLFVASFTLTVIGVGLGLTGYRFPLTLDMTLSSMLFFFAGYKLKRYDFERHQLLRFLLLIVIWAGTLLLTWPNFLNPTYYEVWFRRYPLFPICIICAISGTMVFLYLVKWICKIPYWYKPLAFIGRWTLILVMVHALDQFYFDYWFNFIPDNFHLNNYIGGLIGLGISLLIIGIIYLFKYIRKRLKKI